LGEKKPAETYSVLVPQNLAASYPEPFMVAVSLVTDRRVLLHHEKPRFPTSKRAKVELSSTFALFDKSPQYEGWEMRPFMVK
jgi:hypothetical protein